MCVCVCEREREGGQGSDGERESTCIQIRLNSFSETELDVGQYSNFGNLTEAELTKSSGKSFDH